MNICMHIFYMCLYTHWLACLWNVIISINGANIYLVDINEGYKDIFGNVLIDFNSEEVNYAQQKTDRVFS